MLKICVVDDSSHKLKRILEIISMVAGINIENIETAPDLVTARRHLQNKIYDLLVLDLNLPERFGDDPSINAGRHFIKEIKLSSRLNKPGHIIGITAFTEAHNVSKSYFEDDLWHIILFDEQSIGWEKQLTNKIEYLMECQANEYVSIVKDYDYDLAIITALHEPELRAVKNLDIDWQSKNIPGDSTEYLIGTTKSGDKAIKLVAASAYQMGMPPAAVLSMKLILHFRPRLLAMCGIAAGVRSVGNLGDILITEHSWDYNSGKLLLSEDGEEYFQNDPKFLSLEPRLRDIFANLKSERKHLSAIKQGWSGSKPSESLNIHIGPVASGSAVIQNCEFIKKLKDQSRKVIGIEMETYGVFFASANAPSPRPTPLSIKSICDFADENKSDDYQSYAAYTSAEYLFKFIQSEYHRLV